MQKLLRSLQKFLGGHPLLDRDAFFAYFHKLPDKIQVGWFRDGKFIIGEINDGEHQFKTQAKSAQEFVKMVNDAIYTLHDIPADYVEELEKVKTYNPRPDELKKLADKNVESSHLNMIRIKDTQLVGA